MPVVRIELARECRGKPVTDLDFWSPVWRGFYVW